MRKITDIINKPSEALQAMVDGLLEHDKRSDFKIDMSTFGEYDPDEKICFGCAATCTLQKLSGIYFIGEEITNERDRQNHLGIEIAFQDDFEVVMNEVRSGNVSHLFGYFEIETDYEFYYDDIFCLDTWTWKEQIPKVLEVIEDLKKKGF